MNQSKILLLAILSIAVGFTACEKPETDANLALEINGLTDLGENFRYEGWIIVDGNPITTGTFTVNSDGELSESFFTVDKEQLDAATAFALTIEPIPDNSTAPSAVHILAGDFSSTSASLTVDHKDAIGTDFSSASGGFILATPTTSDMTDENSGVWFLDPGAGPGAALDLPTLPDGWAYEGWAVIDGTPVSTGTFKDITGADNASTFSGPDSGPPFPGEDFVINAPTGLSFPTDLAGATIVVSVEPVPDNSAAPFLLKPLVGEAPTNAIDHTLYSLGNNSIATNPTGKAKR